MKRAIFAIALLLAFALPARAQQPQPADAGQAIANKIGTLVMQNAGLTEQVVRQQAMIAGLQKQLADARAAAAAPKPDAPKGAAPAPIVPPPSKDIPNIWDKPDIFDDKN
jgi:hypothetical protein